MIADVALPIPLHKTFSYSVAPEWAPHISPFVRVQVPFGRGTRTGFVIGLREGAEDDLKGIESIIDLFPLVTGSLAELCRWASRHYITPIGLVLKYALPSADRIERYLTVTGPGLRHGNSGKPGRVDTMADLHLRKASVTLGRAALFDSLGKGMITCSDVFTAESFGPVPEMGAADGRRVLCRAPFRDRMDYYADRIAEETDKGNNVLFLLPDYHSLGRVVEGTIANRFPGRVSWYGSGITVKARMKTWFTARHCRGRIVLGNKGAVFLPLLNNTLIIVEREEEEEYWNEEAFRFNAGVVALRRALMTRASVIFGSATPSMELALASLDSGFEVIEKGPVQYPGLDEVILEKGVSAKGDLPEQLITLVENVVADGKNVAIYVPRRDYAARIYCIECGSFFTCPVCGGSVAYRKNEGLLACPSCGKTFPYAEECPGCGGNLIHFSQAGAEYLETHLKPATPGARVFMATGETPKKALATLRRTTGEGSLVIVGTRILSKLYGLPVEQLLLVGWEELLRMGGYRAEEAMFQVLGGLIDALEPRKVTFVMVRRKKVDSARFLDPASFYGEELEKRRLAEFPPFTRLFIVEIEKRQEWAAKASAEKVMQLLEEEMPDVSITGPFIQRRAQHHLYRILLRGSVESLYEPLSRIYDMAGVRVRTDPLYI